MPDVTISYTDQEQQALVRVLDGAVRHLGIEGLDLIAHFKNKLGQAQQEALQSTQIAAKTAELNAARVSE